MTEQNWHAAWEIYSHACELSGAEQAGYLRRSGAAPEVLERVTKLLNQAEPEQEGGAGEASIGRKIGPYQLVEMLGEGSMGTVYRAEQYKPIRRSVALKLVRQGMSRPELLERFEIERRALALMDHPNIARVLDAGETETGRPYFAMEYVAGMPITQHCDARGLAVRQRLELLLPVCGAVQHAHQKGIIHRDLKPSNVLVTLVDGRPVPKVIDFGVARAVGGASAGTLATQFGSLVGTLAYMSPEQARLDPAGLDTRTDVYSVGVLAYELLAGTTPFGETLGRADSGEFSLFAALEQIRTSEPSPPSHIRRTTLTREIDWIVMKAIAKDPSRRYQTIQGLANDIQRYLDGEPVQAGPLSTSYRLRKLVERYWVPLTAAAITILILAAATVISIRQAIRATTAERTALAERDRAYRNERAARQQRDRALAAEQRTRKEQQLTEEQRSRADLEAATSRAVARFLQDDLLAQASPFIQAGAATPNPNLTVREVLDRAAARLNERRDLRPEVRADVEHTIASSYLDLGLFDAARKHLSRSLEIRRKIPGQQAETIASMDRLAEAYYGSGDYGQAESIWNRVLAGQRASYGSSDAATLATNRKLADLDRSRGRYQESEQTLVRLRAIQSRQFGPEHPETLRTAGQLGLLYLFAGKHAQAEQLQRSVHRALRRTLGEEHPETLAALHALAKAIHYQSRPAEALPLFQNVVKSQQRTLGGTHPETLSAMGSLASCLYRLGRIRDSVELQTELAGLYGRVYGERHPATLTVVHNLANHYLALGDVGRAIALHEKTMEIQKQVLGPEHPNTLLTGYNLGRSLHEAGRFAEAAAMMERVIEARQRVLEPGHPAIEMAKSNLAGVYVDLGRFEKGVTMATEAWHARRKRFGEQHFQTAHAAYWRCVALLASGEIHQARTMADQAISALRASNPDHPDTLDVLEAAGFIQLRSNSPEAAAGMFQEAFDRRRASFGAFDQRTRRTALYVAFAHYRLRSGGRAEDLVKEWSASNDRVAGTPGWQQGLAETVLGALYLERGRLPEAQALLESGHALLAQSRGMLPALLRREVAGLCESISHWFDAAGRNEAGARWRTRAAQFAL